MSDRSTHSSFQFAIRAIILAGILAACFSAALAQSEDDVIKVDSSIVVLNATIRDAQNHPVSALQQKDFKILEDGVQQQIISFETQEAPFAAVILFDTSGSMESRISIARAAAINFLDGLRADDVTAIYKFDSKIDMVQDFSDSRDVSDKIFDLKADGMTALNDAVYKAVSQLSDRLGKEKSDRDHFGRRR